MRRPLILALLILAGLPAGATAATVSTYDVTPSKYEPGGGQLDFKAAAGERNVVTLERVGTDLVLRDSGAPLTAGNDCVALDPHAARCSAKLRFNSVTIQTLDLDDAVVVPDAPVDSGYGSPYVFGGDGADTISGRGSFYGEAGRDVLTGSPLADDLAGGAGDDVLRGGGGDDTLSGDDDLARPGEIGDDVLDGGPGLDTVSYAGRKLAVRVDLADPAPDGEAGERDTLIGVEGVQGGYADDALAGDGGANGLAGGPGDDVLLGRDGDDLLNDGTGVDTLLGGAGDDHLLGSTRGDRALGEDGDDVLSGIAGATLDGGPGDDLLQFLRPRSPPAAACGAGRDTLTGYPPSGGQRIDPDCEQLRFDPQRWFRIGLLPRRTTAALRIGAHCGSRIAALRRCAGTLTLRLRRPGREPLLLGGRQFTIAPGAHGAIWVAVRRAARGALAAADRPLLDVELTVMAVRRKGAPHADLPSRRAARWRVRLP